MPTIWPAPMRPAAAPTARSLRVAVGQLWLPVGDLDGNHRRIAETMAWAEEQGSDLLVLPELAITGYPPEDLVHHPDFVGDNLEVLTALAELAGDCVTVVGFVDPVEGRPGPDSTPRHLANAVALLYRGEVRGRYHKVLLPNYGVFDERRYFAAGERFGGTWSLHGAEVGVLVCEDLWRADVPDAQAGDGAQIIVSANASPYHRGKQAEREQTVTDTARRCGLPVVYAAGVGGQDEVVFDGGSMIADASGRIVARTPAFTQARLVTDVALPASPAPIRSTFA
ncbi:MAG: nitrilase-related carbon-nitrogen hydrolase, partial [Actinomycetota bacterium]